jgi:hypothetical protein
VAENQNGKTIFGLHLPHQISTKSAKAFMGYMKSPFVMLSKPGSIMDEYGCKLKLYDNF